MADTLHPRPQPVAFDVVVRGYGTAALLAATDFARVGLRTALLTGVVGGGSEHRDYASAWGGVVADVCEELTVAYLEETVLPGEENILGIPGSPLSSSTRRALGPAGTFRAYLDRVRPILAIGEENNLARLVETRLGAATLELLVRPAVRRELDCEPEDVDVRDVAPGLTQAMSRVGALSSGVLELAAANPSCVSRVVPAGGLRGLQVAAERQAAYFAVTVDPPSESVVAHAELDLTNPVYRRALHVGIQRARQEAAETRRALLRDPDYSPIGPVDLER
jgi:oxygen-dependent protoporphyrinogen oxidase